MKPYFMLVFALSGLGLPVSGSEFFGQFLSLMDTNHSPHGWMTSPVLIDTNNTGTKITNAVLDLRSLRQTGAISGMNLGMTMDDAVHQWGKPTGGWSPGCLHMLNTFLLQRRCPGV
jgi:hypothetical protein